MGRGKGVGGKRGDYRPASRRRRQLCDGGDDLGAAGRPVIDQRERHFAAAALRQTIEDALPRKGLALGLEIAADDSGPRGDVIKAVAVGTGGGEQQLDRRQLSGEAFELRAEPGQAGAIGIIEQRQQGLADHPPLVAHALQQQTLAVLVSLAEFGIEEKRHRRENHREHGGLRPQRPQAPDEAELIPQVSSGSRNQHSSRSEQIGGRRPGSSCECV